MALALGFLPDRDCPGLCPDATCWLHKRLHALVSKMAFSLLGFQSSRLPTVPPNTALSMEKTVVIVVGAPSYTSGAQSWEGTAVVLNSQATNIKLIPSMQFQALARLLQV